MNNRMLYFFLLIIKKNGSIKRLLREGASYTEISNLMSFAIEKNFITNTQESISLTKIGEEELVALEKNHKLRNKDEWIEKEHKSIISKIPNDEIFLPHPNELSF